MIAIATNAHGDRESPTPAAPHRHPADPASATRRRHAGALPAPGFLPGFLASMVVSGCLGVLLWTRVNHNI
jgi:hypothetical protein